MENDTPISDKNMYCAEVMTPGTPVVPASVARRLERENARLRSELEEMTARAVSLVMHIPKETMAGDVQKWRDEAKAMLSPNVAGQPRAEDKA